MKVRIIDPGYANLKAAAIEGKGGEKQERLSQLSSGIIALSSETELKDVLYKYHKRGAIGLKYEGVYYVVGTTVPLDVDEERWKDSKEIALMLAAGAVKTNSVEDDYLTYLLAPAGIAARAVSLKEMLRLEQYDKKIEYYHVDETGNGGEWRPVGIGEIKILPQPQGAAYYYRDLLDEGLLGIIVVDIGRGTVDVMSFVIDYLGELVPEWERGVYQRYDNITGNMLEHMLAEEYGYDIRAIRRLITRAKLPPISEKRKKMLKARLLALLEPYQTVIGLYAIAFVGGGAVLLRLVYPELVDDLLKKGTVFWGNDIYTNVYGVMKYISEKEEI